MKTDKKAFLLIEVLLSVTILAVVLVAVIQSLVSGVRATAYTTDYTTALLLAEGKMNDLMQLGSIADALNLQEQFEAPYEKFSYRLETQNQPEAGQPGFLNEVRLKVSWLSGRTTKSVVLTTLLFNEVAEQL